MNCKGTLADFIDFKIKSQLLQRNTWQASFKKFSSSEEKRKKFIDRLASVLSPDRLVLMIQRTQDLKSKKKMSDKEQ
jgi:hypothetical protein